MGKKAMTLKSSSNNQTRNISSQSRSSLFKSHKRIQLLTYIMKSILVKLEGLFKTILIKKSCLKNDVEEFKIKV